jgi:hypothetical protein
MQFSFQIFIGTRHNNILSNYFVILIKTTTISAFLEIGFFCFDHLIIATLHLSSAKVFYDNQISDSQPSLHRGTDGLLEGLVLPVLMARQ